MELLSSGGICALVGRAPSKRLLLGEGLLPGACRPAPAKPK